MSLTPFIYRGPLSLGRMFGDYDNFLSQKGFGNLHSTFTPTFDVRETKDGYELEGELPGVKQKDIEIEYPDPNTMQIKGHTEHSSEEKEGSWWVSERSMGDFRRSFSFPSPVDRDATHAHLKDGILTVTVPKTAKHEEVKKKITIEE
ncbi:heat shock protein Hsp20/Hsp26 [Penicillium samsonianum]|uniref:heat shock protein Hsp20/Hsp26 n=1 Tax=Penicillium samsonianum TaxID=1882272 RepID=UPI0025470C00|nr:heat shock protein Hsp20/Hsp26 [Penicillium samsonianum]KAJ6142485.1 heat shock protein Hsp20/Hsp26 [Penicillium samsonianum]